MEYSMETSCSKNTSVCSDGLIVSGIKSGKTVNGVLLEPQQKKTRKLEFFLWVSERTCPAEGRFLLRKGIPTPRHRATWGRSLEPVLA